MSDPFHLPLAPADPPAVKRDLWITFAATLGCFVVFIVVLYLAYIPQRRQAPEVDLTTIPAEEQWKFTPAGRRAQFIVRRGNSYKLLLVGESPGWARTV